MVGQLLLPIQMILLSEIVHEEALTWEDWDADGLDGLEIWNGLSEFKGRLKSPIHLFFYALIPDQIARVHFQRRSRSGINFLQMDGIWLQLVAPTRMHLKHDIGPFKRTIFPYEYHFQTINTHLLLKEPLNGELNHDRRLIIKSLKAGQSFICKRQPQVGRGFSFSATGIDGQVGMGETISGDYGATLQIRLPQPAECSLLMNGNVVQNWQGQTLCTYITSKKGAYRVEVYHHSQGARRRMDFQQSDLYQIGDLKEILDH